MGLFTFMKEVGEKLLGGGQPGQASAGQQGQAGPSQEQIAAALGKRVSDLGLRAENLQVRFENGTVYVDGKTPTKAEREQIILAVGNIECVEAVQDNLQVAQAAPEAKFYTVQKGDTLSKISKQFYSDANKYMQIFEANKPMLTHPDKIYPGQVLRIPQ